MPEPRFSVVIPLYNKSDYILRTLASVLAQTLPAFEVVVIDDGSRDDGADKVAALNHPAVKLFRQANGGVARARNAGIDHARGDWIAFLDADDFWHPDYLLTLARLMRQHPECAMVACQYRSVAQHRVDAIEAWAPGSQEQGAELIDNLPRRWLLGTCFFTSSVAVRAATLRSASPCFPPGESFGEDLDLWFRLAETSPIALSRQALVARVWVAEGLSVVHLARTEPQFLLRMEVRAAGQQLPEALREATRTFVNHERITLARNAISAGDRRLARQLLWRARRALSTRRWCLTALMSTVIPGPLVHRWQQWRKRRKMVLA